jgi:hypothetical protein
MARIVSPRVRPPDTAGHSSAQGWWPFPTQPQREDKAEGEEAAELFRSGGVIRYGFAVAGWFPRVTVTVRLAEP